MRRSGRGPAYHDRPYTCAELRDHFEIENDARLRSRGRERAIATEVAHRYLEAAKAINCPWAFRVRMRPAGMLNAAKVPEGQLPLFRKKRTPADWRREYRRVEAKDPADLTVEEMVLLIVGPPSRGTPKKKWHAMTPTRFGHMIELHARGAYPGITQMAEQRINASGWLDKPAYEVTEADLALLDRTKPWNKPKWRERTREFVRKRCAPEHFTLYFPDDE